ncbi:hypothetical protein ABZT06_25500 [Streptomyces sp. NPDC005483]|uniref:hypothetical protein n=1 Tax=Streptomyces sp. NPDC005483 TaxID=3154882 RepID=UPI0033A18009
MISQAITTVEAYLDAFATRDMECILSPFAPDAPGRSGGITRTHLGEPLTTTPT